MTAREVLHYDSDDLGVKDFTDWVDGYTRKEIIRQAYLRHSCDEWRIGRRADILQLIEDLKCLLESNPDL